MLLSQNFILYYNHQMMCCYVWFGLLRLRLYQRLVRCFGLVFLLMNPSYQEKNKNPQQGLYSIYLPLLPMPQTERVSATGTRRIKLNLCTRVKFLQNGLKRYSPNSSYIFILRVCLEFAYFAKIKIFLLKILQIKVNVNLNNSVGLMNSIKKCNEAHKQYQK